MDSVPDHRKLLSCHVNLPQFTHNPVRWDPVCENQLFLKQSATLYATYYHLQIFIHRPFIPSFRNPSPTTFPSLAICTNAARSCCHVLEIQCRSELPLPSIQVRRINIMQAQPPQRSTDNDIYGGGCSPPKYLEWETFWIRAISPTRNGRRATVYEPAKDMREEVSNTATMLLLKSS